MRKRSTMIYILLWSIASTTQAEVYRWTDAQGNTVFGDEPPKAANAEMIELPTLTVADRFAPETSQTDPTTATSTTEDQGGAYSLFTIQSPSMDEEIRANNGEVSVALNLKPALQKGHGIVLYLDGKQMGTTQTTSFTLKEVDRGTHSIFAVVHDADNHMLSNTESVNFNVVRAAKR